eukprot:2707853-Alexandrium_andersonii.AAC.1
MLPGYRQTGRRRSPDPWTGMRTWFFCTTMFMGCSGTSAPRVSFSFMNCRQDSIQFVCDLRSMSCGTCVLSGHVSLVSMSLHTAFPFAIPSGHLFASSFLGFPLDTVAPTFLQAHAHAVADTSAHVFDMTRMKWCLLSPKKGH